MTKTLLAMVFSCLMTVGLAGCGSSSSTDELIADTCNKMDTCGFMTASECKKSASSESSSSTAAQRDAAKKCLEESCDEFVACLATIPE
jgi:hypothetical protein